ncbi:MAG: hypothetical protein ACI8XV_001527 [Arenicella sp.]|jgi:hypothetical protein
MSAVAIASYCHISKKQLNNRTATPEPDGKKSQCNAPQVLVERIIGMPFVNF